MPLIFSSYQWHNNPADVRLSVVEGRDLPACETIRIAQIGLRITGRQTDHPAVEEIAVKHRLALCCIDALSCSWDRLAPTFEWELRLSKRSRHRFPQPIA